MATATATAHAGPAWLPKPLMEEYVSSVTAALKVREDARTVQRMGWPRQGFVERVGHTNELHCGYSCSVGLQPANRPSNRYTDVIAYDRTRVDTPGRPEGHYLNANWVRERFGGKWHIATQAPLPTTAHSFLSLFLNPLAPSQELTGGETVAPQTPRTIVQLTQNVERRVTKASPYFPTEVGQSMTWAAQAGSENSSSLPSILIELVATEQEDCWQHSTLRIAYANKPNEARLVRHLLFQGWPDHGVPSDIRAYLRFMKFVDACNLDAYHPDVSNSADPPLVTHCSAGVGRTGTFLALSSILRYHNVNQPRVASTNPRVVLQPAKQAPALPASALGKLDERFENDLIGLEIDSLRDQRPMMVQTAAQVRFVYVAFLAAWRLAIEVEESEGGS